MTGPENRRSAPGSRQGFLRTFADPQGDSAPMPFWMWNGTLDAEEIRRQVGLMAAAGVEAFVIHPREGLATPYLSDTWFEMAVVAVKEAMARGLKVWLYDELNWPSGYAGGRLLEQDPTRFARHLARVTVETGGRTSLRHSLSPGEQLVAAFALDGSGGARACRPEEVGPPGSPDSHHPPPERAEKEDGPHLLTPASPRKTATPLRIPIPSGTEAIDLYISRPTSFSVVYRPGMRYTDLLDPEAVRLFISLTHEQYLRRLHDWFGTTILGFFTDEPGFYNNLHGCDPGTIPWTPGFPGHFRERAGYDLLPRLGALWQPPDEGNAEAVRVRADYHDALADRYRSSFFAQLHDWCRANGLELIGHLLGEEDLLTTARSQGDYFRHFRHMDQAGVDLVGQVSEEQSISVRLGASAALHLGHEKLQSETFGIFGWGLTLEWMRHTADWQAVRGLTRLIPHAFHYSMAGERRNECPPSLFFQNCWWPLYPSFHHYCRRLFATLEQGRPEAAVALFYPLPAVWADLEAGAAGDEAARRVDAAFRGAALALERAQVDFHVLDGEMVGRAEAADGALVLNGCRYTALVLPRCRALPAGAAEKLERFVRGGGLLAAAGVLPQLELADPGGETDPLDEWSARLFPTGSNGDGSSVGKGRTVFIPHEPEEASHPAERQKTLGLLRGLRRIGAAVVPQLERRATESYKRWRSRRRDQAAEEAADSSPFTRLAAVTARSAPAVRILPPDPGVRHLRKDLGEDGALVFLLNQGDEEKRFTAALAGPGRPRRLEPADGTSRPVHGFTLDAGGRIHLPLALPPHGSALFLLEPPGPTVMRAEETSLDEVLTLDGGGEGPPKLTGIAWSNGKQWARVVETGTVGTSAKQEWMLTAQAEGIPEPLELAHGWEIHFPPMEGGQFDDPLRDKWTTGQTMTNQPLQDWRTIGRARYSGTAEYTSTFELGEAHVAHGADRVALLDLGEVRETARVLLNGRPAGDLLWPPKRLRVERLLKPGRNELALAVTNTMASRLEPNPPPSGLLGPVRLIFGKTVSLRSAPDATP